MVALMPPPPPQSCRTATPLPITIKRIASASLCRKHSLLSAPVIKDKLAADYVAFDLNPTRVRQSKAQGFPVFYGDGTEPEVLKTAGMEDPKV